LALAVFLIAGAISPAAAAPRMTTAEATYELGLRMLKRGNYQRALEEFNRVRTYYRDDPLSLKAELAIAEIHVKKSEWDLARVAYEDFMRAHPRYPELDYVAWQLGNSHYKKAPAIAALDQAWTRQAIHTWTGFDARFPGSEHAAKVKEHMEKAQTRMARKELLVAEFYRRRGAWTAVVGRVEPMLVDYPASPDRPNAMALLSLAYRKQGDSERAAAAEARLEQEFPGSVALRRLRLGLR
jgi:outer membrane protein assembly factor BamD